jgi:hypothetical protein
MGKRKTLDFEKADSDAWQMLTVAIPVLAEIVVAQRYDPGRDVLGAIFKDTIDHPADHGLAWLPEVLETVRKHMHQNDGQSALSTSLYAIARLKLHVTALALAAHAQRTAIAEPVALKEIKRRAGKRKKDIDRRADSETLKRLAREIFAEDDPNDVKGNTKNVYKEIGELVAKQVQPPLKRPIAAETVRKWIASPISGNG